MHFNPSQKIKTTTYNVPTHPKNLVGLQQTIFLMMALADAQTDLTFFGCKTKMSLVVRKPAFHISENKDADELRGNREADQRLCFRYIDSTIPLLSKSEISSF